jgi:hypothetical protein
MIKFFLSKLLLLYNFTWIKYLLNYVASSFTKMLQKVTSVSLEPVPTYTMEDLVYDNDEYKSSVCMYNLVTIFMYLFISSKPNDKA